MDYLVFGSAGGVNAYFQAGGRAPIRAAACIGQVTAAAAKPFAPVLTAQDTRIESVVESVLNDWTEKGEEH